MDLKTKEEIKIKIIQQQRQAYDICKYLRSTIDLPIVSYLINTQIVLRNNKIEPITTIKQLPEIRIHHGSEDNTEEFMKLINIDNVES